MEGTLIVIVLCVLLFSPVGLEAQLLDRKNAESPNDYFYYYQSDQLMAVRNGTWKLHLPLDRAYDDAYLGTFTKNRPILYNMKEDIGEQNDVSSGYPEVVNKLLSAAELARKDLGDLDQKGQHTRSAE
jgi:arylsulfatase A-like enzyme